jgi:hypothetical protein
MRYSYYRPMYAERRRRDYLKERERDKEKKKRGALGWLAGWLSSTQVARKANFSRIVTPRDRSRHRPPRTPKIMGGERGEQAVRGEEERPDGRSMAYSDGEELC